MIVKDAEILETLIEAKEYVQQGKTIMKRWFEGKASKLKTDSAKALLKTLERKEILWWK